jgi:hypothetical protein
MDRGRDASFARIRLTGRGSILYRSIAIAIAIEIEIGRPEEGGRVAARQPCVTIATITSRPGTGVLTHPDPELARSTPRPRTGVLDDDNAHPEPQNPADLGETNLVRVFPGRGLPHVQNCEQLGARRAVEPHRCARQDATRTGRRGPAMLHQRLIALSTRLVAAIQTISPPTRSGQTFWARGLLKDEQRDTKTTEDS